MLLEHETLRRDFCNIQSSLENMRKANKIAKYNNHVLSMLFENLSSFIEFCEPSGTPANNPPTQPTIQRLTHPDYHPEYTSEVPTLLTAFYGILSSNRSGTILDCCGKRPVRNREPHQCSHCCFMNYFDTGDYWQ